MNYYRSSWLASWFRVTRATDMLKAFHRLPPDAQEKDWTGLNTGVSPLSCTGRHEMIFSHVVCSSGPLTGSKSYVAEEKVRTTNPLNPTVFMGWQKQNRCKNRRFSLSILQIRQIYRVSRGGVEVLCIKGRSTKAPGTLHQYKTEGLLLLREGQGIPFFLKPTTDKTHPIKVQQYSWVSVLNVLITYL